MIKENTNRIVNTIREKMIKVKDICR